MQTDHQELNKYAAKQLAWIGAHFGVDRQQEYAESWRQEWAELTARPPSNDGHAEDMMEHISADIEHLCYDLEDRY